MYHAKYKPNQLIYGAGDGIAIVTGWTPKEIIAAKLDPLTYAVIGQLYSPARGINYLIRNLLLNPTIRYVISLSATKEDDNAQSIKCLSDFFKRGVIETSDNWLIDSEVTGFVDKEIPLSFLENLRKNVRYFQTKTVAETIEFATGLSKNKLSAYDVPRDFPEKPLIVKSNNAENIYGYKIKASTIAEAWLKVLHTIRNNGFVRPTGYDGKIQELIDLLVIIENEPISYDFPDYFPVDTKFKENYLGQILNDSQYKEGVKYTYGQRLRSWFGRDQIEQVINKLIKEIDSASAVMSLWDVKDHEKGGSPCLNHIWVRVVDGFLTLTATFRSNDMFGAWPANSVGLRALQCHIRDELAYRSTYNLKLGPLITFSQSAHIYDDTWENIDKLLEQEIKRFTFTVDNIGNFIIETNEKIKVLHSNKEGELIACYEERSPLLLVKQIARNNPQISLEHIGYLGIELQKAYFLKENYIQDR